MGRRALKYIFGFLLLTTLAFAIEPDVRMISPGTDTTLTEEQVEDYVGGMLGGTETGIAVTYQDDTGDIDFVVAPEGTSILSTGEGGGTKYLREDGDGTCSWQTPAGSGDVESVGDCASGACLDGTSDGGTYVTFYNIDSNKTQLIASDTASDLVVTLPASTGTLTVAGDFAKDIVAGAGITGAANNVLYGADSDLTLAFDSTELTALIWSDGLSGTFTHTFNASNGTDCVWTYGDGTVNLSTGTLQAGGSAVLTTVDISANSNLAVTAPVVLTDDTLSMPAATNAAAGHATAAHIQAIEANTAKVTESTTAGRSLTLSTYEVNADAELYTDEKNAWIETPAVEAMNGIILGFMNAVTITYVKCMTDAGTVSINLEDGSDNNILSAELVCDVGGQTSCASGCDVNTINTDYDNITAKTEDIDLDISAVATATELYLMIGYTIDD